MDVKKKYSFENMCNYEEIMISYREINSKYNRFFYSNIIVIFSLFLSICLFFGIKSSINDYGFNKATHVYNLPEYDSFSHDSLRIPKSWEVYEEDGWIFFKESNSSIIGFQAYKGKIQKVYDESKKMIIEEWVDFELNPYIYNYDYEKFMFNNIYDCNYCRLLKYEHIYNISISNTISNDRAISNLINYPLDIIIINYPNVDVLKRIARSYSPGGEYDG